MLTLAHLPATQANLSSQRYLFSEVERSLKHGDRSPWLRHAADLANYPLYPYLQYYALKKEISLSEERRISDFLNRHHHSPLDDWLRYRWLDYLVKRGEWKRYADYYKPAKTHNDVRYECWYARSLIRGAFAARAAPLVRSLWLSADSQPAACDAVFSWGLKHRVIDTRLIWQRFLLALERGPSRLTSYLNKLLPASLRPWAQQALKSYQKELEVIEQIGVDYAASPPAAEVMQFAMRRLLKRSPLEASLKWKELKYRCRSSCPPLPQLERALGLALLRDLHPNEAYWWLSRLPSSERDKEVREKTALAALRAGWWRPAIEAIEAMDAQRAGQPQWQYWKARSLYALGHKTEARALWKRLARRDNYYAYLAADQLNVPYALRSRSIAFSQQELAQLASLPAVQRMHEFITLDRLFDARREWNFIREELPPGDLAKLAVLFDRWGWSDGVIRAIADSEHQGDLLLRFPIKYRDLVAREAGHYRLPAEWIYSVIRQESAFIERIKSPAGALGLMQLRPATANSLAKDLNLKPVSGGGLLSPHLNVRLGAAYLGKMLKRYENNLALALTAYNAGPTRLSQWLNGSFPEKMDVWVDTIPFSETRDYVRNVLFYTVVYRHRLGLPARRISALMSSPGR